MWRIGLMIAVCLGLWGGEAHAVKKMKTPWSFWYTGKWEKARFEHKLLDDVLRAYVKGGGVDYRGLAGSRGKLDEYLFRVSRTKASEIQGKKARFAFWINVYNALTLRAVLDHRSSSPNPSSFSVLNVKGGFWKGYSYEVGGRYLTLDHIEHQIMRPKFIDPRLHFAIVCASKGCPDLQARAFTSENLERMLDQGVRLYLAHPRGFQMDRATKTVKISKLFEWFKGDFEKGGYNGVLDFIGRHLHDRQKKVFLQTHQKDIKIAYLPYSWALNMRW
jgi:hypothetical protein